MIGLLWVILTSELVSIPFAIHAIATRRRESTGTLAWVGWLFFPIAGPLLYLFLGTDRIGRRRRRRVQELRALHRSHVEKAKECAKMRRAEFPSSLPLAISDQGFFALTFGNACDLLTKGDDVFKRMIEDIEGATRSVDILSYIIDVDPQTDRIKDALLSALDRGVAVRIIYDGIGARGSHGFLKDLRARGAKCSEFIPLNVLKLRFRMSLRNHRKIAIVDGSIGYIGSMNLSGRHAGECPESQDIVVRVRGPVVEDMRRVFDEDWRFGELERRSHLLRADPELSTFDAVDDGPTDACALGGETLQLVASGPDDPAAGVLRMLVTAIHRAERRVDLATPYFIPPQALLGALQSAAARGVEVRLLVPEKTDNIVVDHAMKLWVGLVLERDISVRTVSPKDPSGGTQAARTFVHEKYAVIDAQVAIMGSSNLDQRSAFLNFEADIVAYGGGLPGDLAAHFKRRWKDAKPYKIPLWLMPRSVRPDMEDLPDWIDASERVPPIKGMVMRFLVRLVGLTSPLL